MKTTELLIDEHKLILRALYVLEQMAARADSQQPVNDKDIEDILDFLKAFGDDHHQGKEEAMFFPALLNACGPVQRVALDHMLFEHDQERSFVDGLEEALRTKKGADFVYFAQRFIHILRNHIFKENQIFEIADNALSPQEDVETALELEAYGHAWRGRVFSKLLAQLRSLEWKYLGHMGAAERLRYA